MQAGTSAKDGRWGFAEAVTLPALLAAPASFLADIRADLAWSGIQAAVAQRDSAAIFDWLMGVARLQGVSDAIAVAYAEQHGEVTWSEINDALDDGVTCPLLANYWQFAGCGYSKSRQSCRRPDHFPLCPLPVHPLRKGALNQAAYSLFLFIRDVCNGDLVTWIDGRLAAADPGGSGPQRAAAMRASLLVPLGNVFGISNKLWSIALADLLLGGDPDRELWTTTGASFIAVDTLVHNFLHRTGILRRFKVQHLYGPGCYVPGGCASILEGLAARIDARSFNPEFPACFPRFVQHAIWRFCAQDVLDVCNGNCIDDRQPCRNCYCPTYRDCGRVPLHSSSRAALTRLFDHAVGRAPRTAGL